MNSNFSHVGILLGTEVSLNGKQNWVQQFQAGYYFNNDAGNGIIAYTQTIYRPTIVDHFYGEIKAGIGWQRVFHPVDAYVYENGQYVSTAGGNRSCLFHSEFPLDTMITKRNLSVAVHQLPGDSRFVLQ
jgi:hypothetical protein